MELLNKILLGIIQGITELLPISSSGHLMIFSKYLNIEMELGFLTFLHLATAIAIVIGFWDEIKEIYFSKKRNSLIKILLIGILPAGITGAILSEYITQYLHNSLALITFTLIFWGIVMIIVDHYFKNTKKEKNLNSINTKNALIVGLIQILALIPGTSRSGITIMAGITSGLNRNTAIAFSFLIGLPLIIGGFFLEIVKNFKTLENTLNIENIIAGIFACIFSFLAIKLLKKISNLKFLTIFGIYRIILGLILIIT